LDSNPTNRKIVMAGLVPAIHVFAACGNESGFEDDGRS
jgi:hypothetical protein